MVEQKIITINPGATSTKIGFFVENTLVYSDTIDHPLAELAKYEHVQDQLDFRYNSIMESLTKGKVELATVTGIAARGGLLPPVQAGAYEVNAEMIDYLMHRPRVEHASNLGALLAEKVKEKCQTTTRAFIYDPVTVDEFTDIARISGLKGIERESIGHALNMRAVAMEIAEKQNKTYETSTLIVAHLGGGNSISLHHQGKMIELLSDDEGPFSTERTGELPVKQVIAMCYQQTQKEMMTHYRKEGGLLSYLGTNDARIAEQMIAEGNQQAKLIFQALAYQIAKGIGSLAPIVNGQVDGIIITGGLAHSQRLMTDVTERVSFIAPVYLVPGEREQIALANGVSRVLLGKEESHVFREKETKGG